MNIKDFTHAPVRQELRRAVKNSALRNPTEKEVASICSTVGQPGRDML